MSEGLLIDTDGKDCCCAPPPIVCLECESPASVTMHVTGYRTGGGSPTIFLLIDTSIFLHFVGVCSWSHGPGDPITGQCAAEDPFTGELFPVDCATINVSAGLLCVQENGIGNPFMQDAWLGNIRVGFSGVHCYNSFTGPSPSGQYASYTSGPSCLAHIDPDDSAGDMEVL